MEEVKAKAEAEAKEKIIYCFLKKTIDVGRLWLPRDLSKSVCFYCSFVTSASWLLVILNLNEMLSRASGDAENIAFKLKT